MFFWHVVKTYQHTANQCIWKHSAILCRGDVTKATTGFFQHEREANVNYYQWCSQGGGGGRGATAPLTNLLPHLMPPKWNFTLYKGLWRPPFIAPFSPPWENFSPPLSPPHFKKPGYATDYNALISIRTTITVKSPRRIFSALSMTSV